jgi:hypothetical protein
MLHSFTNTYYELQVVFLNSAKTASESIGGAKTDQRRFYKLRFTFFAQWDTIWRRAAMGLELIELGTETKRDKG